MCDPISLVLRARFTVLVAFAPAPLPLAELSAKRELRHVLPIKIRHPRHPRIKKPTL